MGAGLILVEIGERGRLGTVLPPLLRQRSISELEGVRFGGVASAAVLRLWLDDEVLIDVRDTVEDAFEVTDEAEELDPRSPPRVNDFSLNCCVLVVATIGLGPQELGCTVSLRGNILGFGGTFGGVRWLPVKPFNEVLLA